MRLIALSSTYEQTQPEKEQGSIASLKMVMCPQEKCKIALVSSILLQLTMRYVLTAKVEAF